MSNKIINIIGLYKSWRSCTGFIPNHVELMITSRCNLRCIMCNVWKLAKEKPELTENEISTQQYIKLFNELSAIGTKSIVLSGGEPTLRKDLSILIKNAKNVGLNVELISNGMLITHDMAEEIVKADLDWISISIDGHIPEIHDQIRGVNGCWEKAVRGIKNIIDMKNHLNSKKPYINISHVVTNTNYKYISEMVDLKSELGYETINFNPIIGKVHGVEKFFLAEDDIRALEAQLGNLKVKFMSAGIPKSRIKPLIRMCRNKISAAHGKYAESINKQINCFAPWNMATIDPFGKVFPCCFATPFQNLSDDMDLAFWGNDQFCMGNINDENFDQIWNGEKFNSFRKICKEPPKFPFCDWCNYRGYGAAILTGLFKNRSLLPKLILIKKEEL